MHCYPWSESTFYFDPLEVVLEHIELMTKESPWGLHVPSAINGRWDSGSRQYISGLLSQIPWVSLQDNSIRFYHSTLVILFLVHFVHLYWAFGCLSAPFAYQAYYIFMCNRYDCHTQENWYNFRTWLYDNNTNGRLFWLCADFCKYSVSSKGKKKCPSMAYYWLRHFLQKCWSRIIGDSYYVLWSSDSQMQYLRYYLLICDIIY